MYAIEICDLSKSYNKSTALSSLNLAIENNIIMGLVGPNGHGKSTTINILAGVIRKNGGTIKINGKALNYLDFKYKKDVGFLLENSTLIEKLSAEEYLTFVAMMHNLNKDEAKKKIEELLEYFDLKNTKNKWIESFSAGMKKKVSLAAAIIHTPKILILDEPFENVDPVSRKKMKDILKRMQLKGTTVLITSHALAEVEDFCDEVAIINKGKIVYKSATKEIRSKIKNELTQETYQSLEEIFIDLTTEKEDQEKTLSWL